MISGRESPVSDLGARRVGGDSSLKQSPSSLLDRQRGTGAPASHSDLEALDLLGLANGVEKAKTPPGARRGEKRNTSLFKTLHEDPTLFLVPEYEDPETQQEVLEEFWPHLFEALLEGWSTDERYWPTNRTIEMFYGWFEVHMSSIVRDLYLDEPLKYID